MTMYRPVAGLGFFFSRRAILAIALTLCLVWAMHYHGSNGIDSVREFAHIPGFGSSGSSPSSGSPGGGKGWASSQKQFVKRVLANDFYPKEYNGSAVRELCAQRAQWQEGIVISCDEIAGGIGNLKMRLLGCARYAIEAGGMLSSDFLVPFYIVCSKW